MACASESEPAPTAAAPQPAAAQVAAPTAAAPPPAAAQVASPTPTTAPPSATAMPEAPTPTPTPVPPTATTQPPSATTVPLAATAQPPPATAGPPSATAVPTAAAAPSPTATALPPTPTPTTPPQSSQVQTIVSYIDYFSLENLTVNVGSTVTWDNKDRYLHTATSGAPGAPSGLWESGAIFAQGGQFSFTFNQVGTFPYYCKMHDYMSATVTVVESGAPASGRLPITGGG